MPEYLCIRSARIYDPVNHVDGCVGDLWMRDGRICDPPSNVSEHSVRYLDAQGLVAMPGGIDMHCHIAGSKVNSARKLRVDDKEPVPAPEQLKPGYSGTAGSVPSTFTTAYRYTAMGYTTAFDAAVPPALAQQAHFELEDTPCIDKGFYVMVGNHGALMDALHRGDEALARRVLAWLIASSKGFAPKIVNPGGVENWKRTGTDIRSLDEPISGLNLTPRGLLQGIAQAAEHLNLPHRLHIHTSHLGLPGNWKVTLESMKSLQGQKAHFTHIQFHSYDGKDAEEGSFGSQVAPLAQFINANPELSVDVGQVMFGPTTSMTGDGPVGYFLSQMYQERWVSSDTEMEAGCGIVPIEYRNKSLIHAWQWVIGLEWYLLVEDPWRVVMSTDHPNGGSFQAYPQIIRLLMDKAYRDEMLAQLPSAVRERTMVRHLSREYTLSEIAIITRSGPARLLGLPNKGHLGVGADADITLYLPDADYEKMFAMPRYVIKSGQVVLDDCEIVLAPQGKVLAVNLEQDFQWDAETRDWLQSYGSVQLAHRNAQTRDSVDWISGPEAP